MTNLDDPKQLEREIQETRQALVIQDAETLRLGLKVDRLNRQLGSLKPTSRILRLLGFRRG